MFVFILEEDIPLGLNTVFGVCFTMIKKMKPRKKIEQLLSPFACADPLRIKWLA